MCKHKKGALSFKDSLLSKLFLLNHELSAFKYMEENLNLQTRVLQVHFDSVLDNTEYAHFFHVQ